MAELIAAGTVEAASADFTVVAGTPVTLALAPPAAGNLFPGCNAELQRKTGSDYTPVARLSSDALESKLLIVDAIGTYRVVKQASTNSFRVDKD